VAKSLNDFSKVFQEIYAPVLKKQLEQGSIMFRILDNRTPEQIEIDHQKYLADKAKFCWDQHDHYDDYLECGKKKGHKGKHRAIEGDITLTWENKNGE